MGLSIAICAGEASGDLNGAHLARALLQLRGDLRIWGAGGSRMREAGIELLADMSGCGAIGIAQSLRVLPRVYLRFLRMRREILRRRPDVFIPIDFGAFNIPLGRASHRNGITTVYYFPPSSWRKTPRSASRLLECGGRVITPFPWSAQMLGAQGVDARFVGHPLLDIASPGTDRATFLREAALDDSAPLVALMPGSRHHEVRDHLPPMIGCANIIQSRLGAVQFVIGVAPGLEPTMQKRLSSLRDADSCAIRVVAGRSYDCMAHSDLLIACSGTATLEAAVIGVPLVIIYKGSRIMHLEYLVRRGILEQFIGMPNIVAGRLICPELIGREVTAERLADSALSLLQDSEAVIRMKSELSDVRRQLGEPGAVGRAAQAVLEFAGQA